VHKAINRLQRPGRNFGPELRIRGYVQWIQCDAYHLVDRLNNAMPKIAFSSATLEGSGTILDRVRFVKPVTQAMASGAPVVSSSATKWKE
jgi:hypothetical protein